MAHIEKRYRCPVCNSDFEEYKDAIICRNKHDIRSELWAVGRYKNVRIFNNRAQGSLGSEEYALKEADLSDFIEERKLQLFQLEKRGG